MHRLLNGCPVSGMQDPRRYFEQTSATAAAAPAPASFVAAPSNQLSNIDVLKAINPCALQSGMDSVAAKQVSPILGLWLIHDVSNYSFTLGATMRADNSGFNDC